MIQLFYVSDKEIISIIHLPEFRGKSSGLAVNDNLSPKCGFYTESTSTGASLTYPHPRPRGLFDCLKEFFS